MELRNAIQTLELLKQVDPSPNMLFLSIVSVKIWTELQYEQ